MASNCYDDYKRSATDRDEATGVLKALGEVCDLLTVAVLCAGAACFLVAFGFVYLGMIFILIISVATTYAKSKLGTQMSFHDDKAKMASKCADEALMTVRIIHSQDSVTSTKECASRPVEVKADSMKK